MGWYIHWETLTGHSGTSGPYISHGAALGNWRMYFEGKGYTLVSIDRNP